MKVTHIDVVVGSLIIFWVLANFVLSIRIKSFPLPPGPRRFLLFGSLFDVPRSHTWLKAAEWRKAYGDLVLLKVFNNSTIFVNSYETAVDLLDKRSTIYSSRPYLTMLCELESWDWAVTFMPYGKEWQRRSNLLRRYLDPAHSEQYYDINVCWTHKLLSKLLDNPANFYQDVMDYISTSIVMITYGHEVKNRNDPYLTLIEAGVAAAIDAGTPGRYLVDLIPWLKYLPSWMPGANFRRIAKEGCKLSQDEQWIPYNATKAKFITGISEPSFESILLEAHTDQNGNITDDETLSAITGIVYAAGSDTANSVLLTFLLAMSLYPDIQKQAQKEIDRVVGIDRLPGFEDRDVLPYVNAIIDESLRWNPVVPLGVPHESVEDDVYNGYFIPKGTSVVANQWLMLHDPDVYPDPFEFKPERFFDFKSGGPLADVQRDPKKIAFGFGRRICPGRHLGLNMIYIAVASILAAFDIKDPTDMDGNPLTGPIEYTADLTVRPKPFKCVIMPRSEASRSLVQHAANSLA